MNETEEPVPGISQIGNWLIRGNHNWNGRHFAIETMLCQGQKPDKNRKF
jgi:hypothetical protein